MESLSCCCCGALLPLKIFLLEPSIALQASRCSGEANDCTIGLLVAFGGASLWHFVGFNAVLLCQLLEEYKVFWLAWLVIVSIPVGKTEKLPVNSACLIHPMLQYPNT